MLLSQGEQKGDFFGCFVTVYLNFIFNLRTSPPGSDIDFFLQFSELLSICMLLEHKMERNEIYICGARELVLIPSQNNCETVLIQ